MEEIGEDNKEKEEAEEPQVEKKRRVFTRGDVERDGGGQYHDKPKRTKQFQEEVGLTSGCRRCHNPQVYRRHSDACEERQAEWKKRKEKAEEGHDQEGATSSKVIRRRLVRKTNPDEAEDAKKKRHEDHQQR